MLWPINDSQIEQDRLGALSPEKILFEFEGPRTFTSRDNEDELLLLHQCGQSGDVWRYFVVPFSESLLNSLENGTLDLRSALDQPRMWIADLGKGGVTNLYRIKNRSEVENYLPFAATMLYPELEPLLSVRSVGKNVELGQATLGTMRNSLDNVRSSLKVLADFAIGEVGRRGQPSAKVRRYYDLPAVLAAGSIRISVLPEADKQQKLFEKDEVWQRMEQVLNQGIDAALRLSEGNAQQMKQVAEDELAAGLKAVYLLSPPAFGAIERTEISGRLADPRGDGHPVTIDRSTRTALRQRLRLEFEAAPEIVADEGIISELDREESTFLLRDEAGNTKRKVSFDAPLFDEVMEAFESTNLVRLDAILIPPSQTADLLAITPLDIPSL